MRITETRELITRRIEFPADTETVVEKLGDVTVESPSGDEEESIGDVLERSGVREYSSVDELYDTIIGNLADDYVGRKFYDDRGPNHKGRDDAEGAEEVSF